MKPFIVSSAKLKRERGSPMNIFILSACPIEAAKQQCDKHVVKMPVESAQMLASALRRHGATDIDMPFTSKGTPYQGGYPHHPCTVWAGETRNNFLWLCEHGIALSAEYTYRYNKLHACDKAIRHMTKFANLIPVGPRTSFVQAMPDQYKIHNAPIKAFRKYYLGDKSRFATWNKGRDAPSWWVAA